MQTIQFNPNSESRQSDCVSNPS